jgi:addiction module HigA family antidote
MRVSVVEAAKALGVTSKHVSGIVNGHVRITAELAIRLATSLGTDSQTWLNLQTQHDLWVASQRKPPNVKPSAPGSLRWIVSDGSCRRPQRVNTAHWSGDPGYETAMAGLEQAVRQQPAQTGR